MCRSACMPPKPSGIKSPGQGSGYGTAAEFGPGGNLTPQRGDLMREHQGRRVLGSFTSRQERQPRFLRGRIGVFQFGVFRFAATRRMGG
jgi:hypothetical protein